ncbi:hypothetical protein [Actinoplanes couchii]|uniref:hypothetical protein n=1 Tax=Actinoplanes couchii TaxID=403638 RepID=UPI00286B0AC5|nr:hypothetical protein [Actinoplanes couchii]
MMVAMALLGGTAWNVMNQSVARDRELNHRLSLAGLVACAVVAVGALGAGAVALL